MVQLERPGLPERPDQQVLIRPLQAQLVQQVLMEQRERPGLPDQLVLMEQREQLERPGLIRPLQAQPDRRGRLGQRAQQGLTVPMAVLTPPLRFSPNWSR
jgi:hypothetical protein